MNTKFESMAEELDQMDNDFVLWYSLGKFIDELQEKHDKIRSVNDLLRPEAMEYLHEREMFHNAHQIRDILDYKLWR